VCKLFVLFIILFPLDLSPPIANWPLNPTTYETRDISDHRFETAPFNLVNSEGPCGIPDTGYSFISTKKSKLTIEDDNALAVQAFTIAMYIKPAARLVPLFEYRHQGGYGPNLWIHKKNELYIFLKARKDGKRHYWLSNLVVPLNKWSFVAATSDNHVVGGKQTARLFLDDVYQTQHFEPFGALDTYGDIIFGRRDSAYNFFYSGSMAMVKLFDKALSVEEVWSLRVNCRKSKYTRLRLDSISSRFNVFNTPISTTAPIDAKIHV
jgi:hypothetical protein